MITKYRVRLFSAWVGNQMFDDFDTEEQAETFGKVAKREHQYGYEVEEYRVEYITVRDVRFPLVCQTVVPKGTKAVPATNLPDGGFWAEPWPGMRELEESWMRNYGFHLESGNIEEREVENG